MPRSEIDHLVVIAPTLDCGAAYLQRTLGVAAEQGGAHPRMGTHNLLLSLGPEIYLEVLAIDPAAPAPERPRWFNLDTLPLDFSPRLAGWMARTDHIRDAVTQTDIVLGDVESMSRSNLRWLLTVGHDGGVPAAGIAPNLIQWISEPHPAKSLPDRGCRLGTLQGCHPQAPQIVSFLGAIGFEGPFAVQSTIASQPPRLTALINTPSGVREISSA